MTTSADKTHSYAAIDLGSNSFHMVVARLEGQSLRLIDRIRDSVRLGSGLDGKKNIKPETMERAQACLAQFEQRLRGIPRENIRIVGTNTLRRARNADELNRHAESLIGRNIEIISGREEARLIFSAVAHGQPNHDAQRLVIDIGGGSTELITGAGFRPNLMESTNMGCVSYSDQFFPDGHISDEGMRTAILHAELELQPIIRAYREEPRDEVIGCSGTIKSVEKALVELGLSKEHISRSGLKTLCDRCIKAGSIEKLKLESVSNNRCKVLAGGIAVLYGIMRALKIDEIRVSPVALREGVIYDMIGKAEHEDVQQYTINQLQTRYWVDKTQAERVTRTAGNLFRAVAKAWELDPQHDLNLLTRAAQLHEIGLILAHQQYHKHGEYILKHSDMLGFSRTQQYELALLVRYHRRKVNSDALADLPGKRSSSLTRLLALLRIAVLLHRDRYTHKLPTIRLTVRKSELRIGVPREWMESHPLTTVELVEETGHLKNAGIKLVLDLFEDESA
ncbi:exopolyphosphatase [Granulosicoccaceae sp. 1_MG-2023]|nr:exopolyphosphatase [Granulosicoccaceae sp. 1_MG-2023]